MVCLTLHASKRMQSLAPDQSSRNLSICLAATEPPHIKAKHDMDMYVLCMQGSSRLSTLLHWTGFHTTQSSQHLSKSCTSEQVTHQCGRCQKGSPNDMFFCHGCHELWGVVQSLESLPWILSGDANAKGMFDIARHRGARAKPRRLDIHRYFN